MIGNAILSILGENPSSVTVMFVFSFATVIMTTFLSNMATQSVLIPIAASVALAAGWDPRGLVPDHRYLQLLCSGLPVRFR